MVLFWMAVIVTAFLTQILSCFRRDKVRGEGEDGREDTEGEGGREDGEGEGRREDRKGEGKRDRERVGGKIES